MLVHTVNGKEVYDKLGLSWAKLSLAGVKLCFVELVVRTYSPMYLFEFSLVDLLEVCFYSKLRLRPSIHIAGNPPPSTPKKVAIEFQYI